MTILSTLCSSLRYGARRAKLNVTAAVFCLLATNSGIFAQEPPQIVAFGDSLTQGYGLIQGEGLVPQLKAWLDKNGVRATILNAGVSGDTTAGGLERIDWTLTPDVSAVIIILGGNDLLRGLAPKDTKANLEGIIAKVLAKGLPVLLVPIAAPGNYGPAYQNAFDAIFPYLAQSYNISLATPLLAPLLEHGLAAALKNYMQSDAVHPNPAGVQKVVAELGPQVAAWITKL